MPVVPATAGTHLPDGPIGVRARWTPAFATLALLLPASALAQVAGPDAVACTPGGGPAILAEVTGLKDARGSVRLEIYPATEADFLRSDRDLIAEGKTFRRIAAPAPAAGRVALCIRVPRPGRYALLFSHDRDGRNKFNFWTDGAGFATNARIGRARPKLADATVEVGAGVTAVAIRAQYLRGLGGFAPLD